MHTPRLLLFPGAATTPIDAVRDRFEDFLSDAGDKVTDVAGTAKDKLPGR